jgi:hypothetical protein
MVQVNGGCMDTMLAKLISSREKSIKVLEAEIARLQSMVKSAGSASTVLAFKSVVLVKEQRLSKLKDELAGFVAEKMRQLEIPDSGVAVPASQVKPLPRK